LSVLVIIAMLVPMLASCGEEAPAPAEEPAVEEPMEEPEVEEPEMEEPEVEEPEVEEPEVEEPEVEEPAEVVEITMWHHEAAAHRVAAIQKAIDTFNEENPDVYVVQEVVMWEDAWPKNIAAVGTDTAPEMDFAVPDLTMSVYRQGGLAPVTDIVEATQDSGLTFYDNILSMFKYRDEYWGVPIWALPFCWVYRPSYLEEYVGTTTPPDTWEETLDYAEKLTVDTDGDGKTDIYGCALGAAKSLFTQEQVWSFMQAGGANWFDADGNLIYNSPETVATMEYYGDLWAYSDPASTGWAWGECENNFFAGRIAMMPMLPSLMKRMYEESETDEERLDIAVSYNPTVNADDPKGVGPLYPYGIHVFKEAVDRGTYDATKRFAVAMNRPDILAMHTIGQEPGVFLPTTEEGFADDSPFWTYETELADGSKVALAQVYEEQHKAMRDYFPVGSLYGFTHGGWDHLAVGDIAGALIMGEVAQLVGTGEMEPADAVEYGAGEMQKIIDEVDAAGDPYLE
jgi:multiple sugar transport system substrate-binding protein